MKDRKWTFLNKAVYAVLRIIFSPLLLFSYSYEKYKPKSRVYLLLCNHNSGNDQYYQGLSFKAPMRFVASEHLFRKGFASRLLMLLANPIPRKKGGDSGETVDMIKKTLSEGVNVCMNAEGNRSWSGRTGFISPKTAGLAKESGCALITFRYEGGYLKCPRWAKRVRGGRIRGRVMREYSADELARMSESEVYKAIISDLGTDAFEEQRRVLHKYKGKALAENLETMLYLCPVCRRFETLSSKGDTLSCTCGYRVRYNEYGYFEGENAIFKTTLEWDEWQLSYLKEHLDEYKKSVDAPITQSPDQSVFLAENGKTEYLFSGVLSIFGDRLEISDGEGRLISWELGDIHGVAVSLKSKLLLNTSSGYYEVKSVRPRCSYKYMILCRLLSGKDYII